jgi:hypothetical protein
LSTSLAGRNVQSMKPGTQHTKNGWTGVSVWSSPASETSWGRREVAIGQIGMALIFAGILIFVATYCYWLFGKKSDK